MSMPLPTGPIQGASMGDELKYAELLGSLLLVVPTEHIPSMSTVHGVTDAVRVNVVVLDGPQAGREFTDAMIFPRVLKSSLKSKIGQIVVGRLAQGAPKPGQNAPWIFIAPSDAELATAQQYVAQRAAAQVQAPAPVPQSVPQYAPPAQPPVQQYAQPPVQQYAPAPQPQTYAQPPVYAAPPAQAQPVPVNPPF